MLPERPSLGSLFLVDKVTEAGKMSLQSIRMLLNLEHLKDICAIGSINSHYFHITGDGHQPNGRGLYTHYKDSY